MGSAALRDLGLEHYNEGYKPTTVYMGADGQMRTYEELEVVEEGDEVVWATTDVFH